MIECEIEGLPHTTNSLGRKHWTIKAAEAKKWINLIACYCPKPPKPFTKAKLTLIRYSSSTPDSDGLVSSFKHVIDGLVHNGIIENDKFTNIGMPDYQWEKVSPKEGKIFIRVEGVE